MGNGDWVSFDTPNTLSKKVCYAKGMKLGGVFAWDGNQDTADWELLRTVKATVKGPQCGSPFPDNCPSKPSNLVCEQSTPQPTPDPKCAKTYTVKAADTCWALTQSAAGLGLPEGQAGISKLLQLNPGLACERLQIGQALCVGDSSGEQARRQKAASLPLFCLLFCRLQHANYT